jgi:coenzyme F420-reducing hydrogenase alpha subunit
MQSTLTIRMTRLRDSGRDAAEVLGRWRAHEWRSLQGHRVELQERLRLAREARGLRELIQAQIDLVPESWRRLQRDALTRRALWSELGGRLRGRAD